jgi:hypothetical protein
LQCRQVGKLHLKEAEAGFKTGKLLRNLQRPKIFFTKALRWFSVADIAFLQNN